MDTGSRAPTRSTPVSDLLSVEEYHSELKDEWDSFVSTARNGLLLFRRGFLEHHQEKYQEASLLFRGGGKLLALLPANREDTLLVSHRWITFGGFVTGPQMTQSLMLRVFTRLRSRLLEMGMTSILYKPAPYPFHRLAAQEDLYALVRVGAQLVRRDASTVIDMSCTLPLRELRRRCVARARRAGLEVVESRDYRTFWKMLASHLAARHGVTPAHTVEQILHLSALFPNEIKLFAAVLDKEMLAGAVVFEHASAAHVQYMSSSTAGRELGALDLVLHRLIEEDYRKKRYLSFGISTEDQGRRLNEGLISQKEGFGGRTVVHDFYEWNLENGVSF